MEEEYPFRLGQFRAELDHIRHHNVRYFAQKKHSDREKEEHLELQARVSKIREELARLLHKKIA